MGRGNQIPYGRYRAFRLAPARVALEHKELQRVVGDPPAAAIHCQLALGIVLNTNIGVLPESERLARRFFTLYAESDTAGLLELIHPELEWVVMTTRRGDVLRGRDEVAAFLDEISGQFIEFVTETYRPLDDERLILEGRLRWIDEERVLRDDPFILAMVFRDGLVWRSTPAQSVVEAEAILSAPT